MINNFLKTRFIILCGGIGSRLWPISTKNFPKQFVPIYNNLSLFDMTKLKIIEIQLGTYFDEDDIIRLDDPYKR